MKHDRPLAVQETPSPLGLGETGAVRVGSGDLLALLGGERFETGGLLLGLGLRLGLFVRRDGFQPLGQDGPEAVDQQAFHVAPLKGGVQNADGRSDLRCQDLLRVSLGGFLGGSGLRGGVQRVAQAERRRGVVVRRLDFLGLGGGGFPLPAARLLHGVVRLDAAGRLAQMFGEESAHLIAALGDADAAALHHAGDEVHGDGARHRTDVGRILLTDPGGDHGRHQSGALFLAGVDQSDQTALLVGFQIGTLVDVLDAEPHGDARSEVGQSVELDDAGRIVGRGHRGHGGGDVGGDGSEDGHW